MEEKLNLPEGWHAIALENRVVIHDNQGNAIYKIENISLEDAARIFNIGWDAAANSLKGKLVETVTRPPLALDPDEYPLPPSVAEAIARTNED